MLIEKTFTKTESKVHAEVKVTISENGKIHIAFDAVNKRKLQPAYVGAVIDVLVGEDGKVFHQVIQQRKLSPKPFSGKKNELHLDQKGHVQLDYVTIDYDIDSDDTISQINQQIRQAGQTLRQLTIQYGADSEEVQEAIQAIKDLKEQRDDAIDQVTNSKKLQLLNIRAEICITV